MVKKSEIFEGIRNPRKAVRVTSYRLDTFVSKIMFKNTAGFTNNISGLKTRSTLEKLQSQYITNRPENPISIEFKNRGHAKLGCIYDNSLIERLASEFNKKIEDDRTSSIRAQHDGQIFSRSISFVHKNLPEVVSLITEKVVDVFEQYYKSPFKILDIYAWRNYHVPYEITTKIGGQYSDDWHCDGHNTTWTKLMVYLTDVTEEDGPFNIQSIERTKELMKKGFGSRNNPKLPPEILEDPNHSTRYIAPKGTAIACNTEQCLHRAIIPKPGHFRDIIQFQFAPSTEPMSDDWPSHLKSNKEYQEN